MRLDPYDLMIFATVADAGGLARAALQLDLPKSTVSRRLAALETAVGERLLQRTTRKLVLTDFGRHLLGPAQRIASDANEAAAVVDTSRGVARGRLRVSMPADLAGEPLSDAIARFVREQPGVQLELDLSARRVDLIGEGFDLAIRTGPLADDPYLAVRRLASVGRGLYAAPHYLAQAGRPTSPEDLSAHRGLVLVGREGEPVPWTLERALGGHPWTGLPSQRMLVNSYDVLTRLAAAGAGVAALPDLFAKSHLAAGRLEPVMDAWRTPSAPIWAVFPSRRLIPAKAHAFVDLLVGALAGAP